MPESHLEWHDWFFWLRESITSDADNRMNSEGTVKLP